MMKLGAGVQLLPWDSEWLGFPVARLVTGAAGATQVIATTVVQCRAASIRLLYLLVDPADSAASAAAQTVGASLVDVRQTYRLPFAVAASPVPLPPGIALTRATVLTPSLEELAWQSGEHSRFRRDARIGDQAFRALYTRWLCQALAEGVVWVAATENEETAGMLAFESGDDGTASIALLAVAPMARRQRIGQYLVQTAALEARHRGCTELRVVTQGTNHPAWQLYEQCGFGLLRTEYCYHLWL